MKKFPSIIRLPRNQQFSYTPRFYDPVKEDIKNRSALIESGIRQEKKLSLRSPEEASQYRSRISMAYSRRTHTERRSSVTQIIIAAVLMGLFALFFLF